MKGHKGSLGRRGQSQLLILGCAGATALFIILVFSLPPLALATLSGNDTSNATSAANLQNYKET
ncbi:MAG TPA: hypothetical protein VF884_12750, partial [Nitrososphaeraceae archaeon]